MNKLNIALWTLYDFANSIVVVVFFLYFSQWLVIEKGVSDLWYNMIFTIGSALLLFTAPVLGSIADRTGRQQTYLNRITVLASIGFLGAALVALFYSQHVFLAIFFFLLAVYLYQFSLVFYNALLPRIAPREMWGKISGIGQAGNWLGQIAGLLLVIPFVSGAIYIAGEPGRAQTFLPATLAFVLLALPLLVFFKLPPRSHIDEDITIRDEYRSQWRKFKELIETPSLGFFLISFFFFNDAILTAANNFPIYLQNVFGVPDATKSILLTGVLLTSAAGALGSGWLADRIGLKKTLSIVLGSWIVILPLLGITIHFNVFIVLTMLMGFFYGSVWTVSRAAMTALCPKAQWNFGFSFYTLAERVSTLVGPLAWGLITTLLGGLGPVRYRIAVGAMAVFVAIGVFFLRKVTIEEHVSAGGRTQALG